MSKILSVFFSLLLFLNIINAQNIVGNGGNNNKPLINNNETGLNILASFDNLSLERIKSYGNSFFKLIMKGDFGYSHKIGYPELPVYYQLIEIPYGSEIEIIYNNVVEERYSLSKYDDFKVIPLQYSLSKSDSILPFVINDEIYNSDSYFGFDLVSLEIIGYMGGVRLARLAICPIKYNPISNDIMFIKEFDATIKFKNADIEHTRSLKARYNSTASNYLDIDLKYKSTNASVPNIPLKRPLKMVIVSDPMFKDALMPFIRWKKEKGIEVIEAYTSDPNVGNTTSSIKRFLSDIWKNLTETNPAPDFLLLCGDTKQIPAFVGNIIESSNTSATDLYYAEFTGDYLPDMFYGRFSAQTLEQMNNIINKTLTYEKYQFDNDSFLNGALLVGGKETSSPAPTCVNGQMNYLKGYLSSSPKVDTTIYYNPISAQFATQIRDSVSTGHALVNYSAHCSAFGWSNPSFDTSNIKSLLDNNRFGLFINNCCFSGKFNENECFTEGLLRAKNKGAIGAIGASNVTFWEEDFWWSVGCKDITLNPNYQSDNLGAYDSWFHSHGESPNNWYITQGQIVQAGNISVTKISPNYSNFYWEIYNLMGDPSLMPYVGIPKTISCNYPKTINIGENTFDLVTAPFAMVCLSKDGCILGAAQADNAGKVHVFLENPPIEKGFMKIVITGQFYKPIIDSIELKIPLTAHINIDSVSFFSSNKSVKEIKNNEEYFVGLNVSNLGLTKLDNIEVRIKSDSNIKVIDSVFFVGSLRSNEKIFIDNVFKMKIIDGVVDNNIFDLIVYISGNNQYQNKKFFRIDPFCPNLVVENLYIETIENDYFKETDINICFDLRNIGRNISDIGMVKINNVYNAVINDSIIQLPSLKPDNTINLCFKAQVSNILEDKLSFNIVYQAGNYQSENQYEDINLKGTIEDFESGDFSYLPWVNDKYKPWTITDSISYLGRYSVRSGKIKDNQKTTLTLSSDNFANDSISFYVKTSTEKDYDVLRFYIDNVFAGKWSGKLDWTKAIFSVGIGKHTYKWEYSKDYSTQFGDDAVWIDNVCLPINGKGGGLDIKSLDDKNIIVYPNPAKNIISIQSSYPLISLSILDIRGREVIDEKEIYSDKLSIDISSLLPGVYFIYFKSNEIIGVKKLIVTK